MKKTIVFLGLLLSNICMAQKEILVVPDGAGYVQDMVISKDQKYLYTLNNAKVVMWDVGTGKQLYTFRLDGEDVYGIAVSNDGSKVAVAAKFKNYCFSTITGKPVFKSKEHTGISNGLIFSPDDKIIYIGNEGLWEVDAETGKSTNKIFGNNSGSAKHLFYIDNNTKLVVPGDESWEVYDIVNRIKLYNQSCGALNYIAALPEQGYVIGGRNHDAIKVFDIKSGKEVKQLAGKSYDAVVIPSLNSHQLIFCADGIDAPQRVLYNTDDFTIEKKFISKIDGVNNGSFFGKDNFAFIKINGKLQKFNIQKETALTTYEGISANFGSETFSSMEYNRNNGILNITTDENNLKTIDLYRMRPIRHTTINTGVNELAFSPSGDTIATFNNSPFSFTIKNIVSNNIIKPQTIISNTALDRNLYFFSPDAVKLFYPLEDYRQDRTTLIKYNIQSKATLPVLKTRRLDYVFVNSDKDMLAAIEWAIGVKTSFGVWDINTGKRLLNVPVADEDYKIRYITVSKDKKYALALQQSKLYYFDLTTSKLISTSTELQRTEETGTFSADPGNFGVSAASSDLSLYAFSRADGDITEKGELFVYKRTGELVYRINAHSDNIRSILFSPDDKIIYTVSHDQTIKMWNTATGKLIGTLYLFKTTNDFVFVDADGRFDGSDAGLKQLYFIRNREALPLDRLFEKYYQPNLYARIVSGEIFDPIPSDIIKSAPLIKISYAAVQRNLEVGDDVPSYQNTTGMAEITVNASASDDAIDEIRLFQNGKVLNLATRNLIVEDDKSGTSTKKYTLNLLAGKNEIRAVALNTQRTESKPDVIEVIYNDGGSSNVNVTPVVNNNSDIVIDKIDKNATMYLMVVGINAYTNKINPLTYALPDATAFKEEIEKDAKSLVADVKTYFITDAKADKESIINAFAEIKGNAKPQDIFVFYYAGHGYINPVDKEFYLVSANVTDAGESLLKNGIRAKELQQYAIDIQAQKQLFILDACQSAGAFNAMLQHDGEQQKSLAVVARSTGTHWMAASGSTETAKEFGQLGHGAFTFVLLQALKGQAAANKMITVNGLKNFLQVQVPELVKKYGSNNQYPASYGFGNDFPVEIVK